MRRRRPRLAGEEGQVAGVEAIAFGLLVFVIGALVVANAWGVVDAKTAADAAAREAARAYVESPSPGVAAGDAHEAAAAALAGYGRDPARMELAVDGSFARCARIAVEVRYPVPAIVVPWVGGLGTGFTVRARHSELVDPFRSGLAGRAGCAG